MTRPSVSVVVVSRGRPDALKRCILGLSQLTYAPVECVVVACTQGATALADRQKAGEIKLITYDTPNISAARNLGIAAAAGEVVAFIDDDAVPEPLWLHHLTNGFQSPETVAVGGFVLGRNGVSFQWQARSVDETGEATDLALDSAGPVQLHPAPGRAIKTEGTNMALRRDALAEMGGFDPAFRFYLDETDLNMRLARAGHPTALVPLAQVHHGFEASDRRMKDRTPLDLTEIAASKMVFLRKHCPAGLRTEAWSSFRAAQRQRVLRAMQRGPLGADDVHRILHGLERGRAMGADRDIDSLTPIPRAPEGFCTFPTRPEARHHVLSGRIAKAQTLRKEAKQIVASGDTVSLFLLSRTAAFHRVRFTQDGTWEQTGGLWGKCARNEQMLRFWRFSARVRREWDRVKPVRAIETVTNL